MSTFKAGDYVKLDGTPGVVGTVQEVELSLLGDRARVSWSSGVVWWVGVELLRRVDPRDVG